MASDRRWTGGVANREWQRGTTMPEPAADTDAVAVHVKRYLTDCRASPHLDAKYHPTEAGALKIIFHHGHAQADAIRAAFHQATGT